MADTPLSQITRGADRNILTVQGQAARLISDAQLAAIQAGGWPEGVARDAIWRLAGGVPDYGGKDRPGHGEYVELVDRFELGVIRRDGRRSIIAIRKTDVNVSNRGGGLTIDPKSGRWDAATEIMEIAAGVLRTAD